MLLINRRIRGECAVPLKKEREKNRTRKRIASERQAFSLLFSSVLFISFRFFRVNFLGDETRSVAYFPSLSCDEELVKLEKLQLIVL